MEFRSMKRKQLQALCKKHGVPANLTNLQMVDRLSSILKEKINEPDAQDQSAGSNPVGCEKKMDAKEGPHNAKKVRFSPNNETFLVVSSNVKTSVKLKRTTRSRLEKQPSVKRIDSPRRSSRSRAQNLAKKVVVRDVSPFLETRWTRQTKGHSVAESAENNQGKSDGIVDVKDRQTHLENVVPKKRAEELFNRSKSAKNTAGHFIALPETDNSSAAHQRDCGRKPRKKLEPQKKTDEDSAALDEKPKEIKISGRVTRMRSRMIFKAALMVAPISEAESQGEAGPVKQREEPAKAVSGNFKKPRTSRKNLGRETHISSNHRGEDSGQGKLNGMKRDKEGRNSSILSLESVKPRNVETTVVPGNKALLRRSKRKPQLSTVLADETDAVDRMNSQQKQEDSLHAKVAQEKLMKGFTMDIGSLYEEPSRTSGSLALNAVQLYPAEVSSETIGKKHETGSEALISEDVSSIPSPSEAKSSLPDGFDHVKKLKMKNHVVNCEEKFDRVKSEGAETPGKGGYANQKAQELPSNVAVVSEELSSFSEDCERDFQAKMHNQSSPPQETAGSGCACLSSFNEGFEAEQVFAMKHDCFRGITELDHQDDWHGNRVSERGTLTPVDRIEDRNHNMEEPTYGCQATQLQVWNSALQTEGSRIAGEDIQLKTACPISDEALCRERHGDGLPSEKFNKITTAEAIDKQITNQDAVQAVGPLMAVLHMDASDECLGDISPGRDSVATKQHEVQSSWQTQESDYASNQMLTDTWNDFVGVVTNAAEAKSTDTTNRQGIPSLRASKSYNQESLDENKEGSGTRLLDLHFHLGEIDGGSSLTPQTVPDACLNLGSIISEKISDPSSFGISGLFDHMVRGCDAEFYGDDHPEKVAAVADAHRNSMSPTEAAVDRQKHMGTKYDDVYRSDGLSGIHCGDTLRVNDVRPYYDIETCGDYHLEEVAADANIETFSQAETSAWKNYEQGNMEAFSAHTQSSGYIMANTGRSILHHCSNPKKLNISGQEDMKNHKHDHIDLEADLDGLNQELLSIKASRDRLSRVQTAISGLPHSNDKKSSSKAQKSGKLPEQDSHECISNTPPPSVEGSFDADKASEILRIGEYKLRMATPEQDAIISKDELTITSTGDPKSSKAKSFTSQDIKDITNHMGENTERSVFSKRITSSPENCAENDFLIDQNASSPAVESKAKLLTSPATLLEDIQRSLCSSVEVAAVEDIQWLARAILDDTYDGSVKCTESSGSATLYDAKEEAHGTSVQENDETMTIQNALIFAADSQHTTNASHVMDEKTEKPSNAQTFHKLGLNENKGFAVEDLYPLFGGEEPNCKPTVQNLSSNTDQKLEEESVELKISEFPKNKEENDVGMEKIDFIYALGESENQLILPCVEQKSDNAKEANEENGSHMLADKVQASDPMVESRSPHTCSSRSPVLYLANSAIHDCSKFSDVQVEDPTFTSEMSPRLGDSLVLHNASNMSTDDQNVRFECENIKQESMQQINHQNAPGAEEIAENTNDSVHVSWEPNFKDAESAEEEFKDIDFAESIAQKNALADDFHAQNIKGLMDDQEAALAMIQKYMNRKEEDETRTIKSSIGCNNDEIFPYTEADYLPAGVLFSENRDFIAIHAVQCTRTEQLHVLSANSRQRDRSSKQIRKTHIPETHMRTAPRASDMKENTGGIKTARAPTTASKTWTMRRALDVLPNK